jgi:hypothetical protein
MRSRRVDPNSPGIRRKAMHFERKLRRILTMAARQDSRRSNVLARLYREARVEGISQRFPTKTAIISFEAPPFRGGLYEMYEWQSLELFPESWHAEGLAWGLRERVRERLRGR